MSNGWRAVFYALAVALFLLGAFVARGKPFKVSAEFLIALGLAFAFAVPFYDAVSA